MYNSDKNCNIIGNMGSPFFHEFKKQASFFLKEKIKTARLALTDVTPTQLLAEEAINGNPGAPDTRILKMISKAAFDIDDYSRIVEILHKRFVSFDTKNWRSTYNSMIVLEHLLTHGPESVSMEFEDDKDVIKKTGSFQYVDEKGFNWGLAVKNKAERIVKLLENRTLLKEERNKARTITRGIEGFGSFKIPSSCNHGVLQESSKKTFNKSISQFNYHIDEEEDNIQMKREDADSEKKVISFKSFHGQIKSFKENMSPPVEEKAFYDEDGDFDELNSKGETNRLLGENSMNSKTNVNSVEDDHPFNDSENHSGVSLLSSNDHALQAC